MISICRSEQGHLGHAEEKDFSKKSRLDCKTDDVSSLNYLSTLWNALECACLSAQQPLGFCLQNPNFVQKIETDDADL